MRIICWTILTAACALSANTAEAVVDIDALCPPRAETAARFKAGSYPPAARPYREAAKMAYRYMVSLPAMTTLVETGRPNQKYQHNAYVSKTHAAHIEAMLDWMRLEPEMRETAMRFAKASAEFLLKELEPGDAPLAFWPPTYGRKPLEFDPKTDGPYKKPSMIGNEPEGAVKYRGEVMLLYPATVGIAFVDYWRETRDGRFLAAAGGMAETYLKTRREDGSWPLKMKLATGETVGENTLVPTRPLELFEKLFDATGEAKWRAAADGCFAWLEAHPLRDWNWDGQFEDIKPEKPYKNPTKHNAVDTMLYILKRFPGDRKRLATCRKILEFCEKRFVVWEAPVNHSAWPTPCVLEQYSCFTPIDASSAKMIRAYLAMYRAEGRIEDLGKAKALADTVTRVQKPSGRIPTFWEGVDTGDSGLSAERYDWLNCMAAAAAALVELAKTDAANGGADWPVARRFDGDHLLRVALPMGGIGCGSVSLSGRGELVDWEIMNRANKNMGEYGRWSDVRTFFAIRVKGAGHESTTMLAGPLHPTELYESEGSCVTLAGLPRFRNASFEGAFPFGTVHLEDRDLPVKVRIRGFSPFVPGDSEASSLPVASLEYDVENLSGEPLEVSVAAFVRNFVGNDGLPVGFDNGRHYPYSTGEKGNHTVFREGAGVRGVMCLSDGVATNSPAWGTFALSTSDREGSLTFRESFVPNSWNRTVLDFWDDLSDDGELNPRKSGGGDPHGGLCLKKTVPAGGVVPFRFAFTWRFPNRPAWGDDKTLVGNWYSIRYADAWDAAEKIVPRLGELEAKSLAFTRKVLAVDAPAEVKEAALSNLAVLKSQTMFRVPSGHLLGWEGVFNHKGSCMGSCTHVWNYENAVACLFPGLARSMRDVEFNCAMDPESGAMDFRVALPLGSKRGGHVAADGQMGCIMKVYRDWRICGDDEWLAALWPKVKKALSFAWIPAEKWTWKQKWVKGGWDVGKSGLMDGEQHNTMDVNYYGPNPQMGFWYLGALRAAEEMAKAMKDDAFAKECRKIYEKGARRIDAELFNGDYYEQRITEGHGELPYQLGKCCLVDQLVGQQMAHICGLGDLAKRENLRKTCESIMRWNFLPDFYRHFNNMRTFCAGDEAGLIMGSWPRGRLKTPFPYFGEVMTGFEYVAAAEMVFQGMDDDALKVVKAVRDRYDGLKRNPFSEAECGHNYARSMASWNVLLAWIEMHGGRPEDLIWK